MDEKPMDDNEASDDELAEVLAEGSEGGLVPRDRAERFYDRMRASIQSYVAKRNDTAGKAAEYLLLVPDVFILLWRLAADGRVAGKAKMLLGTGIAYYLFPFDIMPEGFMGPMGFMDDLVFAAFILNRMITDTDREIVREHWSGRDDVFGVIQKILEKAEGLVGGPFLDRVKRMIK